MYVKYTFTLLAEYTFPPVTRITALLPSSVSTIASLNFVFPVVGATVFHHAGSVLIEGLWSKTMSALLEMTRFAGASARTQML